MRSQPQALPPRRLNVHICLVSDAKLPVRLYGGTERIVQWLAEEFLALGHQVTLVALAGSHLPGVRCIPVAGPREAVQAIPANADICHFHAWPPSGEWPGNWLFTLHGNAAPGEVLPARTVCISADHARRHGVPVFIHNGVNARELVFRADKQDHLLFFSKVRRRVKGAARALRLARAHGQRLAVAGGTRLDLLKTGGLRDSLHPSIRFHGEVGGAAKAQLFADAKALLFPIAWDEPFGLVLVEALLSGTPVIATPRGSVPEIISPDVGALFTEDSEFADALAHAARCDPQRCREWALERFSARRCALNHIQLYERILGGEPVFGS